MFEIKVRVVYTTYRSNSTHDKLELGKERGDPIEFNIYFLEKKNLCCSFKKFLEISLQLSLNTEYERTK